MRWYNVRESAARILLRSAQPLFRQSSGQTLRKEAWRLLPLIKEGRRGFYQQYLKRAGFTLLEVLVAVAVLAVALVSLLGLHNRNLALAIQAERLSIGTLLAREVLTRTQLEGLRATQRTSGDFSEWYPDQYPGFRWRRMVRPTPLPGLWELWVGVTWGERAHETCELTLFTTLNQRE